MLLNLVDFIHGEKNPTSDKMVKECQRTLAELLSECLARFFPAMDASVSVSHIDENGHLCGEGIYFVTLGARHGVMCNIEFDEAGINIEFTPHAYMAEASKSQYAFSSMHIHPLQGMCITRHLGWKIDDVLQKEIQIVKREAGMQLSMHPVFLREAQSTKLDWEHLVFAMALGISELSKKINVDQRLHADEDVLLTQLRAAMSEHENPENNSHLHRQETIGTAAVAAKQFVDYALKNSFLCNLNVGFNPNMLPVANYVSLRIFHPFQSLNPLFGIQVKLIFSNGAVSAVASVYVDHNRHANISLWTESVGGVPYEKIGELLEELRGKIRLLHRRFLAQAGLSGFSVQQQVDKLENQAFASVFYSSVANS